VVDATVHSRDAAIADIEHQEPPTGHVGHARDQCVDADQTIIASYEPCRPVAPAIDLAVASDPDQIVFGIRIGRRKILGTTANAAPAGALDSHASKYSLNGVDFEFGVIVVARGPKQGRRIGLSASGSCRLLDIGKIAPHLEEAIKACRGCGYPGKEMIARLSASISASRASKR
jgi:hypothetical protein